MKRLISLFLISSFLFSCGQENQEKQMEEIIQQELALTQNYTHRPAFGAQVTKNGCKLIIEVEGAQDYRFIDNNGQSTMLPLNVLLFNAGKKNVIIKVYPRDGEDYLSKYANASVTIYRAADKNTSLKDYQQIAEFNLPQGLEEQKLPYYEAKLMIDVDVPFTYDQELAASVNLKNVPNIEQKIVEKYNQIRTICINRDEIVYHREFLHSSGIVSNTTYENTYEEIKNSYKMKPMLIDSDSRITNHEFLPIENYTIQYYANGKIVALWQKNLCPMLYMKARVKNDEGEERNIEGGRPIFLYMPQGSNELKVW
ncbi:hypothetical protein J3U37_07050 [Gilliamella sp. B3172]|uniref:hypothetical protein n=1 Tax=Gilliamella sp. B3172 TaxID=2818006 RepID=UPI00226AC5E2|nr:hypothetical protein [Gilliamella sp. B3172]MCX8639858.1 hypothetical protein [Gilliamella sp. B3172]